MTVRVVYHSQGGNTEKLARAVAEAVGVAPEPAASAAVTERTELLLVGTALYGGKLDRALTAFLAGLDPALIGRAAVFSNAAANVPDACRERVAAVLGPKGIAVAAESFFCRGRFLFANKGRPNTEDLRAAAAFAARMAGKEA